VSQVALSDRISEGCQFTGYSLLANLIKIIPSSPHDQIIDPILNQGFVWAGISFLQGGRDDHS
jgi:hypothetical protein